LFFVLCEKEREREREREGLKEIACHLRWLIRATILRVAQFASAVRGIILGELKSTTPRSAWTSLAEFKRRIRVVRVNIRAASRFCARALNCTRDTHLDATLTRSERGERDRTGSRLIRSAIASDEAIYDRASVSPLLSVCRARSGSIVRGKRTRLCFFSFETRLISRATRCTRTRARHRHTSDRITNVSLINIRGRYPRTRVCAIAERLHDITCRAYPAFPFAKNSRASISATSSLQLRHLPRFPHWLAVCTNRHLSNGTAHVSARTMCWPDNVDCITPLAREIHFRRADFRAA